jgi:hypothetical protein
MASAGTGIRGAIDAQLEGLSIRERRLISGLILLFCAVISVVVIGTVRSTLNEQAENIQMQKDKIAEIEAMKVQYARSQAIIASAEERQKKWEGKAPSAFFEQIAGELELREELAVNKQGTESEGAFNRTTYRITVRRLSLQQAVQLLYDIETSGYPIRIDNVTLRTLRTGDEKVLTANLDAVHFVLKETP